MNHTLDCMIKLVEEILPHAHSLHMDIQTTFYIQFDDFFFPEPWMYVTANHIVIRVSLFSPEGEHSMYIARIHIVWLGALYKVAC